jgi:tetratricopeptide (TPR) repeat protein
MLRFTRFLSVVLFLLVIAASAQQQPPAQPMPGPNQTPPRSDERNREAGESSSRDTRIDISPPKDDAKNHPDSGAAISDATADDNGASDVQEFHPWDPHKALKDVEIGDYYFKRKNYKAALSRYREALVYKNNDAVANFRMAQCLEKLDQHDEARLHYQEYLKILPHGPFSEDAHKALQKLGVGSAKNGTDTAPAPKQQ